MQAIITIGYYDYLVPDEKTACDIMRLMTKATAAQDWHDRVEVKDDPLELKMRVLRPNTRFTRRAKDATGTEIESDIIVTPFRGAPKRLTAGRRQISG